MSDKLLEVIDDGAGQFFGVVGGHIRKLYFLRLICSHFAMTIQDLDFGISCMDEIKHGMCRLVDRDNPETWDDNERESMDEGWWPYEWDAVYWLDPDGDIKITSWIPGGQR